MQAPTLNKVSQEQHSPYKAVDYRAVPDIFYYAPEDGIITGAGNSGTCGYRLGMDGATGAHGFCHNEEVYVSVGQKVKRGQKLAKMGYTGYTKPSGPGGRHLHWVINRNGSYVYPPSLVNEPFIKLEGGFMYPNKGDLINVSNATGWPGHPLNDNDFAYWVEGTGNPNKAGNDRATALAIEVSNWSKQNGQPSQYEKIKEELFRKK